MYCEVFFGDVSSEAVAVIIAVNVGKTDRNRKKGLKNLLFFG